MLAFSPILMPLHRNPSFRGGADANIRRCASSSHLVWNPLVPPSLETFEDTANGLAHLGKRPLM